MLGLYTYPSTDTILYTSPVTSIENLPLRSSIDEEESSTLLGSINKISLGTHVTTSQVDILGRVEVFISITSQFGVNGFQLSYLGIEFIDIFAIEESASLEGNTIDTSLVVVVGRAHSVTDIAGNFFLFVEADFHLFNKTAGGHFETDTNQDTTVAGGALLLGNKARPGFANQFRESVASAIDLEGGSTDTGGSDESGSLNLELSRAEHLHGLTSIDLHNTSVGIGIEFGGVGLQKHRLRFSQTTTNGNTTFCRYKC